MTPNEEDRFLRDMLISSASTIIPDPHDERFFRYWIDDGLEIRSCKECESSDFKSKEYGDWVMYFTKNYMQWVCEQLLSNNVSCFCSTCDKWDDFKWKGFKE